MSYRNIFHYEGQIVRYFNNSVPIVEIMASNEWADDYCMKISDNSWFDNSVKELFSKINPGKISVIVCVCLLTL
jgi:hypothetical protein